VDAQHRLTKTGRQFGSFVIEDYTGKTEMMLWSDDYTRYAPYLEKGKNLFITGCFKLRFNKIDFEFKIEKIILLESIKQMLTKQVIVDVEARHVDESLINFLENNFKTHPGRSGLKFNITDARLQSKITMYTMETGLEMNDELAAYLYEKPELEVQVVTN
jgi:DNA polymerase-3 subunit alpha